jgi:ABC-2 type transport system permease protein
VLCTSAGLVLGLFSNSRRIPTLVADGSLDEVLTLPVAPLPNLLVRRLDTVNLGDVAFGLVLFAVAAHPTPQRTLVYVAGTLASAVLLTGFLVLTGSLVFFTGRGEGADLGLNAVLLLASYPADVFAGATKVLLYTVVPAAFVSGVPAELVDDFDLADAALLLGVAGGFAGLGWAAFTAGLRRYSSGSAWARG